MDDYGRFTLAESNDLDKTNVYVLLVKSGPFFQLKVQGLTSEI